MGDRRRRRTARAARRRAASCSRSAARAARRSSARRPRSSSRRRSRADDDERPKPGRSTVEPWPTYGHDDATLARRTVRRSGRPSDGAGWSVRGYYIEFPPAVAYGRVLAAQLRGRALLDRREDRQGQWRKFFSATAARRRPRSADGVCVLAVRAEAVHVRRPRSRRASSWRSASPAARCSGATAARRARARRSYVDGILYFGSWDHHLYALDVTGPKPRCAGRSAPTAS